MHFSKNKKIQIAIGAALVILLITNPSLKDFKEFSPSAYHPYRKSNFFIASVYVGREHKYLGFIGNFWDITSKYKYTDIDNKANDSTVIIQAIDPSTEGADSSIILPPGAKLISTPDSK